VSPPSGTVAVAVDGVRYTLAVSGRTEVRVGREPDCDAHLPPAVDVPSITVRPTDEVVTLVVGEQAASGPAGAWVALDVAGARVEACHAPASSRVVYDLRGRDQLVIGPRPGDCLTAADPGMSLTARRRSGGGWAVSITGDDVFVNDVRHPRGRVVLHDGDHLGCGPHDLVLFDQELHVDEGAVRHSRLPRRAVPARTPPPGYPDVRRSPRLVHRPPEGQVTVNAVPTDDDKRSGQLAKLIVPPLLMLGVTAGMAFLQGNPLFVLASGATSLVTVVFSVVGYRRDRRTRERERVAQETAFREHLRDSAVEIHAAAERQRSGALYHYPDLATLAGLTSAFSPRVFEKAPSHADFLHFRLGLGTVPASTTAEYADRARVRTGAELDALARHLCDSAAALERMPVTADLRHGPVGYVGPRRLVVEQLQILAAQLAFFHSYHDLQFVIVFPDTERTDWEWVRWYRHSSLRDVNVRGFVHDQRSRDQVLSSLDQILKARQHARSEHRAGRSTTFVPHIVVVVLDETLVTDHVVMEFLRQDPVDLGCSVVVVQETMSGLSDSVTTVIDIRDKETGVLVLEKGELRDTRFVPDRVPAGFDPERLSRMVGALHHLQDVRSSIPESVTFLELYEVERVDQLTVPERWAANAPHRTLGVPLGLRGPGDVVRLDLHEKAHGPHGLVAGTTGSGKSEIIQSYILSLAVTFHPHDVAFLLIDYKGGGMANLFADLPHLLGTITNLDGAQSMRALVSINAELKRRQRVFAAHDVNHINQYQKLVKDGEAAEPMPHLFLISDEFAELKSEQPEFMDELVSTARIGRSLGIHLILATQKPSGVVNDQIWSNSKFKLALKVADRADSMEIIKTPDAAEIALPGRAYLQVGNNEIYELFQSAWSGADYRPDRDAGPQEDVGIFAINDLGQYEILNPDLSGLDRADTVQRVPTELEAVVAEVARAARDGAVPPLPRPWLSPLPERIHLTDLDAVDPARAWREAKSPLRPVVGTVDVPSMQTQDILRLDLSRDGHLALFASPGYGKSTFLQTLVMGLSRRHSPDHLHVYLLDLGTNGLLPLRGLPQVADTLTIEDSEKAQKLAARLESEIKRRKRRLSEHSVASLEMFERASGEVLPALLLVVDGVEGLKGTPGEEVLTGLLTAVAREGAGLGIHLVMTAGRQASLRTNLSANIKTQIALRLNDDGEARGIVGRTALQIDDVPGRGLVRLDQPEIFQTALPAPGDDTLAVIEAIQAEARELDAQWRGDRPEPLPVIPERLDVGDLVSRPETERLVASGGLPVGLDLETVHPAGIHLLRCRQAWVLAGDAERVARAMATLWDTGTAGFPGGAYVLDDQGGNLRELVRRTRPEGAPGAATKVLDAALAELTARQEAYRAAQDSPEPPTLADHARALDPALVVLADAAGAPEHLGEERVADLVRLLVEGPAHAMPVLVGGTSATAGKGFDGLGRVVKKITAGLVVGRFADQSVLKASNVGHREPEPGDHEGYVVVDGRATRVKLPASG
jgi:S-DNA-T family DNA segregation ATPase FtsK/SpoIIIE